MTHANPSRRLLISVAAACTLSYHVVTAGAESTIRQFQLVPQTAGYELELKEVPRPVAQAGQVLVRVHAVSLNRRDLMMLNRQYRAGGDSASGIPLSDGAGEVIAVGAGVTRLRVGDRVAGIFFEGWIDGKASAEALASARGGNAGGMLSEVIVTDA